MRAVFLLFVLGSFLIGCSGAKIVAPTAQSEALEALIAKKSFTIESDWMYPLATSSMNTIANSGLLPPGSTVNGISLIGNQNYVRVHGDSISMELPFYGERQLPGQFTRNEGGIVFKGVPDRYEVTKDEKRQRHMIKFTVKNNRESYRVMVTLYPNWTSNININSSHRTSIRYRGNVSILESDDGLVTN
ncbi:protein of unknown function [Aquimarina amphilecti]|uniref:DUF4251 domain-containing protein n=1 Tax=Aquimarina amphilecti TaxID=1038014 RepID=A0A1H7H3N4_AQUAM|nr:DUF4251 domain-containing protein [Aquimarina amphilecti]SEK44838.1 protein of unknown function [Aquimarina amphilecti]